MKFAVIEGGAVVNITTADPDIADELGWIIADENISIGDLYSEGAFSKPPPTAERESQFAELAATLVEAERDRRIDKGFSFSGLTFQSDRDSRENINGASTAAVAYLMSGGDPTNASWTGGDTPFGWLANDNTMVPLTAPEMIAFGNAALAHKSKHIFAARTLKAMEPIPVDFADDKYWP
ncbi:MAG: DUF4376 domain-containing protein [Pikeienuella sp.]